MSVGQGDGFRCALPILRMTRVGKGIANNSRLRLNTRTPPPAPASRPRWRTPRAAAGSVEPEPPPSPPSQASHEVPDARCLHLAWVRPRVAHSTKTPLRSEEHTSELQSLMRLSPAVYCLNKQHHTHTNTN